MKIFLAGATGATGRLLAEMLLDRGHRLVVVVRSPDRLPRNISQHEAIKIVKAPLLDLEPAELTRLAGSCDAFVSCLGHTLSWKGIFGPPYRLVTEAARRLCRAAGETKRDRPARYILMSSAGIRNPDEGERISFAQHLVIQLLRLLLPPHADNEKAAAFLRNTVSDNSDTVEWVAVRPDALVDETEISPYSLHRSPTRSAIFDSGKTSRINVADFMADLIEQDDLWAQWKGKMPVIYNNL
jgi:nucleoside-diphosphate-sugar epimerase